MLRTFTLFFFVFYVIYGVVGIGSTFPSEIYQNVNENFKIWCYVGSKGSNQTLNFYSGNDILKNTKIINDTSIELSYSFSRPTRKNFTCKLGSDIISYSIVNVDHKPGKVSNFTCRTVDLKEMECEFRQMSNKIPITYRLDYKLPTQLELKTCRLEPDFAQNYKCKIYLKEFDTAYDNQTLFFNLSSENVIGHFSEQFEVQLLQALVPQKPYSVEVLETFDNINVLVFQLPPEIAPVAKYLQFEGGYKSEFDQNNWSTLKMSSLLLNGKVAYLNLDQLYYSFASYDFRVRIKSKMARKKISWSDYAITTFKTRPSIPNTAPNSCQSCYHQINNGNIFLYWKEIERSSQNGPGFGYFLVGSSNGSEFFKNATFKTHLLLENLPNGELKFLIYSLNSVGSSTVATEVIVLNSKVLQVANPFKVRKELIEDHKYRISWTNKHQDQYLIDNFIVFWCSSKNDLPNNCEGSIDFQYVASNESSFERQTELTSNFAVSVNYFNVSRTMSMVWAECTAAGANDIGKIQFIWAKSIHSKNISVEWKLDCVDEGVVKAYQIKYCRIVSRDKEKCLDEWQTIEVNATDSMEILLENLQSYQCYKIKIAMLSRTRQGPDSDILYVETLESAPSSPTNKRIVHVSDSAIVLAWQKPLEKNGPSLYFDIWFNDEHVLIQPNATELIYPVESNNNEIFYEICNLLSYTNYVISILACTISCSEATESLRVQTKVGVPGRVLQPAIKHLKENYSKLVWQKPKITGGLSDFYQLRVLEVENSIDIIENIYIIGGSLNECLLQDFSCSFEQHSFDRVEFNVRSVNIDPEYNQTRMSVHLDVGSCFMNKVQSSKIAGHYYGEWSQPIIFWCHLSYSHFLIWIILLLSLLLAVLLYLFYLFYNKYKQMKDIEVELPKGLTDMPYPEEDIETMEIKGLMKFDLIQEIEESISGFDTLQIEKSIVSDRMLPFIRDPKTDQIRHPKRAMENVPQSTAVTAVSNYNKFMVKPKNSTTNYMGYTKMRNLKYFLTVLLLTIFSLNCSQAVLIGWTYPEDPIHALVNQTIRIICVENDLESNSTHLGFYDNKNNKKIKQGITILNETAIEMKIENAPEMDSTFICKLNGDSAISYNEVKVGYKPGPVKGIKCRSLNWQNCNCTFQQADNPIPVNYSLAFKPNVNSMQIFDCKLNRSFNLSYWCLMDRSMLGIYRPSHRNYTFVLSSKNDFGSYSQTFYVDHFAIMIPDKPKNLTATNTTSTSVTLNWQIAFELKGFPVNFTFEMVMQSVCEPGHWKAVDVQRIKKIGDIEYSLELTNLTFAHTWYDIRLRMKSEPAENTEEMWSKQTNVTFQTLPRLPDKPPTIDRGSFNIHSNGDLYLYWRHLGKCYQNGANFNYTVEFISNGNGRPNQQTLLTAIFRKERFNTQQANVVRIWSSNGEGRSLHFSELTIPGIDDRFPEPRRIKKSLKDGEYHLSWSAPLNGNLPEVVVSYTVFWCVSKSELPNHCESSINFTHVNSSTLNYRYRSDATINFAVAANSLKSTSGMIWALCTAAQSNDIGKIKTIWIPKLSSTEIELEWKLECVDASIVEGYTVQYCPISAPKTLECKTPEITVNTTGSKYTLRDLTPYTTYKIVLYMYSNTTLGPASDPLANTTLEAPPSEPRGLIARDIRNTSVNLFWDPPEHFNGVLMDYQVWYNGDHNITTASRNASEKMNYHLTGLKPFITYKLLVKACTSKCSNSSNNVIIKTKVGDAGPMVQPTIRANANFSMITIEWVPPVIPNGNIDYYEVKTQFIKSGRIDKETVIKSRQKSCVLHSTCQNVTGYYTFAVRAINYVASPHSNPHHIKVNVSIYNEESKIISDTKHLTQRCDENDTDLLEILSLDPFAQNLKSNWSSQAMHSCQYAYTRSSEFLFFSILLMVMSFVIAAVVFMFYKKIKNMKDILVQMPPGLEDLTSDTKKGKNDGGLSLGVENKINKPDILSQIEEESLLKRSSNSSLHSGGESYSQGSSQKSHNNSSQSDGHSSTGSRCSDDDYEYDAFKHSQLINDDRSSTNNAYKNTTKPFIVNPNTGEVVTPKLLSSDPPVVMSTPIIEKMAKSSIVKMPVTSNGYISQPNGYVTQVFTPTPSGSDGYTQLNAFGKPILVSPSLSPQPDFNTGKIKTPIVALTDQEGISGYVTHKQLSDFAEQRMQ